MKRYNSFKVASVSSNTNSFGLYGMVLVAKDGEAWEVGANHLNVKKKGEVLNIAFDGKTNISRYATSPESPPHYTGFEIPNQLPNAPPGVIKEVWDD